MIHSQHIADEQLGAYVDGELDAAASAVIRDAVAADPALAARVAQQQQLRALLRGRFDPVVDEPVPQRLLQAAAPAFTDIRAARARAAPRSWSRREWGAMAATLVLGLFAGLATRHADDQSLTLQGGKLVAGGNLARALASQLAGQPGTAGAAITLSIQTGNGEYCRSFTLHDTAGLACRRADQWVIDIAAQTNESDSGDFRQAGSALPHAVRAAIEQRMTGEPLTESEEITRREAQWRATAAPRRP